MIDTLIFDFGDIFVNLNVQKCQDAFRDLGLNEWNADLDSKNEQYEKGLLTEDEFLKAIQHYIPTATLGEIKTAWNAIIGDFPEERLEFLQLLSQKYRLFLLTNTDKTHIQHFEDLVGVSFYSAFYQCFEKVFFSYELHMRKPDTVLFTKIINNFGLSPKKTLFVDDKSENTLAAQAVGLHVWNLKVGHDDVTELFEKTKI